MRLAHKRRVQQKLKKTQWLRKSENVTEPKVSRVESTAAVKKTAKVEVKSDVVASMPSLTPKQQQVLDVIQASSEAMSPKAIGVEAGQDESKAAAWATGGIKKLLELELVEKIALSGNKVAYQTK